MKMKTKTHGWILQAESGAFVDTCGDDRGNISSARVFTTRKQARTVDDDITKFDTDVVRKVEVDKNGKAVKIIKGR